MPDRYIERKGIIFNQIAERGDVDQTTKLQKENRVLIEKVERLEEEYNRLRKASEFIHNYNLDSESFWATKYEAFLFRIYLRSFGGFQVFGFLLLLIIVSRMNSKKASLASSSSPFSLSFSMLARLLLTISFSSELP